jgi:hypothetical protein
MIAFIRRRLPSVLIAVGAIQTCEANDDIDTRNRVTERISVACPAGNVIPYGSPTTFHVIYHNSEAEDWTIPEKPSESGGVSFELQNKSEPLHRRGWSFGGEKLEFRSVKQPNGAVVEAILGDPDWKPPPPLLLKPNERYQFDVTLSDGSRFLEWHPGVWYVYVRDTRLHERSKEMEVTFALTASSVTALQRLALDRETQRFYRLMTFEYLQKIRPGMTFAKPKNDGSEVERLNTDAQWQRTLVEFGSWWKMNAETPEVQQRIDDVNREYGLDPIGIRKALAAAKTKSERDPKGIPSPKK